MTTNTKLNKILTQLSVLNNTEDNALARMVRDNLLMFDYELCERRCTQKDIFNRYSNKIAKYNAAMQQIVDEYESDGSLIVKFEPVKSENMKNSYSEYEQYVCGGIEILLK